MALDPHEHLTASEISSRLTKEVVNHPMTLGCGVSGVLLGSAAALFSLSDGFLILLGAAGLSAAAGIGFVLNKTLFSRHNTMIAIIEKVRTETLQERLRVCLMVEQGLNQFDHQQGLAQLELLHRKFGAFENVLNLQFDKDEMTHKRYLTTAEQLYFAAVDNLRKVVILLHSLDAIDVTQINQQLALSDVDSSTAKTLIERLAICDKSQQQVKDILVINEQVMTQLDQITNKLGTITTRDGLSEMRIDAAMKDMMHLISRVDNYDIGNTGT